LTGISALIQLGAWVLGEHPLHVSVPVNSSRLRTQTNRRKRLDVKHPRGVALHWDDRELSERGTVTSVALVDALLRVILDEEFETAVAVLDWALHTGALDPIDFERLILALPAERRGIAQWVDAACESLPESLSRTRLRISGKSVVSQVRLGDLERIDLVVDAVLAIEVDGEQFHLNQFERDRRKDVDMTIAGYHALRPSARMVFHDWDRFALAVERALAEHPPGVKNSGVASSRPFCSRGMTGWRRRGPRRIPEFPNGSAPRGLQADGMVRGGVATGRDGARRSGHGARMTRAE
jgi:very-short-patch-repair endonuclease